MSPTPISLLERLRLRPDAAAWDEFARLYTPFIQGWVRRHHVPPADVDDVVQEVLTVVVRELPGFRHDGRTGTFRCWLRRVTVNRLRAFWRSRRGEAQGSGDSDVMRMLDQLEDPDSPLSRRWDQEHDQYLAGRLLQVVERDFEPPTWQAFRRLTLEDAPAAEVARDLGMSVNAVLLAKSRVLRRLRQEVKGLID